MKTLFASLIIALTVSASSVSFAHASNGTQPIEPSIIVRPQAMKLDVITPAGGQDRITIRLKDASGNTLIRKFVAASNETSLSRFDLSNLEDGVYKVEISGGAGKQVREFTIETTTPKVAVQRTVSIP